MGRTAVIFRYFLDKVRRKLTRGSVATGTLFVCGLSLSHASWRSLSLKSSDSSAKGLTR